MRTTLTIDDDVAETLKQSSRSSGKPFKQVVDEALRAGLQALHAQQKARRYRVRPRSLGGVVAGISLEKALRLADTLEDEAIVSKIEARK